MTLLRGRRYTDSINDKRTIDIVSFKQQLECKKLENKHKWQEKYHELKYKIVYYGCTWGLLILVIAWVGATVFNKQELKKGVEFSLQTIATLYVGSLISKDFD